MSSPERLSDGEIQALLARAVRLYAERVAARDDAAAGVSRRRAGHRDRGDGDDRPPS